MNPKFRFVRWLCQFTEHPRYFPPLAGLYELLWGRMCGYDWKHCWRCAFIYWTPRRRKHG